MTTEKSPKHPSHEPWFSDLLLSWWDQHGRKGLPWQRQATPYRVWVSEIMLQQTQVTTVIPYFQRFMGRFPTIPALATAAADEVLHHWSGLGYYARARNLHLAAQIIHARYNGHFPLDITAVMSLPGIGRSTAGAILALAAGQAHPILDGNVKRVLARLHAIAGWPGSKQVESRLWQLAEYHTPTRRIAHYTQAIMDLGATLCTRSRPSCERCPAQARCLAYARRRVADFPTPKPRGALPVRRTHLLLVRYGDTGILLTKRPPAGVWGGLWSLPECDLGDDIGEWCRRRLGMTVREEDRWPVLRHTFSHFHLDIHPVVVRVGAPGCAAMDGAESVWYNPQKPQRLGLAAPIQQLLNQLSDPRA
ncbi:MAG: A/G-specific adenine glycosylase [Gammaproteobacteria bacterium]|jgi:A/G-specific adenine glycosylase